MISRRAVLLSTLATAAGLTSGELARVSPADAATGTPWRPPRRFVQPVTKLVPAVAGHDLSLGWTGTKVMLTQRALGLGQRFATYDTTTRTAVLAFQRRHGLSASGIVDQATWTALRTGRPWTIDAWRPAIAVPAGASRSTRIEAMIHYAQAQAGSPYTWGGAGPLALGHDCSGLVLAALATAGVDPQPITVTRHQSPNYLTTQHLWDAPFEHVPASRRQRGDLIFWFGPNGLTRHVAIHLGAGRMVEANSTLGLTHTCAVRGSYTGHRVATSVVRPFTALTA